MTTEYVVDLDGTLYSGAHTYSALIGMINRLPPEEVYYLSNTDHRSAESVRQHLLAIGIEHVVPERVETVFDLAVPWFQHTHLDVPEIRVPGHPALASRFRNFGFVATDSVVDPATFDGLCLLTSLAENPKDIIAQYSAAGLIQNPLHFAVSNIDDVLSRNGGYVAGIGSALRAVGIDPEAVASIGKPSRYGLDLLRRTVPASDHIVVIGDNVDTDGALAATVGATFLHVSHGDTPRLMPTRR